MTITFDRPVGCNCDVNELEYISALHQTSTPLREDGSLVAEDIVAFLISRHAIRVQEQFVKEDIMVELAGDPEEEPKYTMDLRQVTALLTLPHLVKISAENDDESIEKNFGRILHIILRDLGLSVTDEPTLNAELVQQILETYGEFNVPKEVIDDMVKTAGGAEKLDIDSFRIAMISDLNLIDPGWETSQTTHWEDIFRAADFRAQVLRNTDRSSRSSRDINLKSTKRAKDSTDVEAHGARDIPDLHQNEKMKSVFTMGSIDLTVDTFKSVTFMACLWLTGILLYLSYGNDKPPAYGFAECEQFNSEFACSVANGILNWCWIFIQLSVLGTSFFILSSMGLSIFDKRGPLTALKLLVGMGTVGMCTIGSFFAKVSTSFFDTEDITAIEDLDSMNLTLYILTIGTGIVLLLLQLYHLVPMILPRSFLERFKRIDAAFTPGSIKKEARTKQAAAFKTNQMIENALEVHELTPSELSFFDSLRGSSVGFSNGIAMRHFHSTSHVRETVGGILWGWKRMRKGNMASEYGVWLHTRLISTNLTQFFVLAFVVTLVAFSTQIVDALFDAQDEVVTGDAGPVASVFAFTVPVFYNQTQNTSIPFVDIFKTVFIDMDELRSFGGFVLQPFYERTGIVEMNALLNSDLRSSGGWFFNQSGWYYLDNETVVLNEFQDLTPYGDGLFTYPEILTQVAPRGVPSPIHQVLTAVILRYVTRLENEIFDLWSQYEYVANTLGLFNNLTLSLANVTLEDGLNLVAGAEDDSDTAFFIISVSKSEALVGVFVGGLAGMFAVLGIAIVYLPSFCSTVLKFRSGVIPSLHDKRFLLYRVTGDNATLLFGSAFWGVLFTGAITVGLFGGVAFLLVWNVTRRYVVLLLGQLIGFSVTLTFKILILFVLRRLIVSAFYRRQPLANNIVSLILEVWNVGITSGYMLVRTAKLLAITAFYIGRIDTPFLASGVGQIGSVVLDGYPHAFRKDLLAHEAHRHPYIERLGALYMLKLRYGHRFATRAGGIWRLVYVSALMPWLSKYRGKDQMESTYATKGANGEMKEEILAEQSLRRTSLRNMAELDNFLMQEELLGHEAEAVLLHHDSNGDTF